MEFANNFKDQYNFHKIKVTYSKLEEKLGMNGPFVGEVSFNDIKINGLYSGPPLISADESKLLLPKFEFQSVREAFRIFVFDINEKKCFKSKAMFSALYITGFNNDYIGGFNANYPMLGKELNLKFDTNNFEMCIC